MRLFQDTRVQARPDAIRRCHQADDPIPLGSNPNFPGSLGDGKPELCESFLLQDLLTTRIDGLDATEDSPAVF